MGNYDYQKPISIAQKRKIAQDREIRKKQEEQFFASMNAQSKKQEEKPSTHVPATQTTNTQKPKTQTKIEPKKEEKPVKVEPKRNIEQERKEIREKLKIYNEGMHIRLRLPDG